MYRGWWQGHGTPSLPFKIIRPEEEPGHVYLIACVYASKGRVAKSHCHVNHNNTGNEATRNQRVSICNDGRVLWGPPTKVVCHLPKKYKRADLAGGGGRWAGANCVLRYQIMGQSQYRDLLQWGCPDAPFHNLSGIRVLGPDGTLHWDSYPRLYPSFGYKL